MIIKNVKDCKEIAAGDGSALRELLHPDQGPFQFGFSLARAVVKPHGKTRPHRLKSSEVYCILEGRGLMHVGEETAEIAAGQAVYIPPFHIQFVENTGEADLAFLCIVDPAWKPEDEEILPDGGRRTR
ncbi:MAG: cupin domain-containing protein [Candidatus Aminicenantales bacterium]|jgi:mannose-6-phosphate isomerase-like protein (cupin superfamily)